MWTSILGLLTGTVGRWLIGGAIIVAVGGGGFLWVKVHYENVGYQKALAAVAAKDAKAVERAKQVQQEVDRCFDDGHTWNVENGACE